MTRTIEIKNYTVTFYGYEGNNYYIEAFSERLLRALEHGYECFVSGKFVYLIENEWFGRYIVTKYLKSDCTEYPTGWLIDDRALRYASQLVARVEVRQ